MILSWQLSMRIKKTPTLTINLSLFTVLAMLCLSGCAKLPFKGDNQDGGDGQSNQDQSALSQYELVAIDMVNAMVQINELHPTTLPDIKLASPKNSFGSALFTVLDSAGYNVRQPELGLVYANLEWSITPVAEIGASADDTLPQTFSIALNGATLSRSYELGDRRVKPTSNLKLIGVGQAAIKLHDEIFDQDALPSNKPRTAQSRRNEANVALGGNLRNIFELGGSNFQDQIGMFKHAGSMVINFPDDSAKLTESSNVQLRRFLNSVSRGTDAVWVIGCSIGSTRHKGGNENLARTRTKVVADWLKKSGMDTERLFEESCWAEEPRGLNMPRRGVQLTLLRERKN